ncbi:MAG: iron chelate uptake ABC transporter family permease subunit [Saprospiraceae bacterium]|nr:iron chelate uptake ABC transporter family permease subunit [Saprospiraceae bacterium]
MENNILRKSGSYYYIKELRKRNLILWLAFICVISLLFLGLTLGAKRLGLEDLLFTILSLDKSDMQYHIIMDLRLPRLLAAVLSGSALGLAGAVMQVILRNPLGSPFTLGISNASAFGAALAYIILGIVSFLATFYLLWIRIMFSLHYPLSFGLHSVPFSFYIFQGLRELPLKI